MSARENQVGGGHYLGMKIQPAEYAEANGLSYLEAAAVKYVSRWRRKNGIQDLRKAIHCIELLIEFNEGAEHGGSESK